MLRLETIHEFKTDMDDKDNEQEALERVSDRSSKLAVLSRLRFRSGTRTVLEVLTIVERQWGELSHVYAEYASSSS